MSEREFGWEPLIRFEPDRRSVLKAALLTTYDRPDERLLVEHLLPSLLGGIGDSFDESDERGLRIANLHQQLEALKGRLVVVSSLGRDEPTDTPEQSNTFYPWIWRSILWLPVGAGSAAVQHAKFWMFHWGATGDSQDQEELDLVISSANLTGDAVRNQIQGVWRVRLPLSPTSSKLRSAGWGILPAFLQKLGESTGKPGYFSAFQALLARATCPNGVTFVASVPGKHTKSVLKKTPWGSAGLKKILPTGSGTLKTTVCCPYIGTWDKNQLQEWCNDAGGRPSALNVAWIEKGDAWGQPGRWSLPELSRSAFSSAGVKFWQLCQIGSTGVGQGYHEQVGSDRRWSHAKLYRLMRGSISRVLLTSANLSTSAWGNRNGDGKLTIKNFELGVCDERVRWPIDLSLELRPDELATSTIELPAAPPSITWAFARWDGTAVHIQCDCDKSHEVSGFVVGKRQHRIAEFSTALNCKRRAAELAWTKQDEPPSTVRLTCDATTIEIPIFDDRPSDQRDNAVPDGMTPAEYQRLLDQLILTKYSAPPPSLAAGTAGTSGTGGGTSSSGDKQYIESYAVAAFQRARFLLQVVDNWSDYACRLEGQPTARFERGRLRSDARQLIASMQRESSATAKEPTSDALGAKIAMQELELRLKNFTEPA